MSDDRQNLKLLSTLHYVMGGITFATSLLALPYIGIGLFALHSPETFENGEPFSALLYGWMFVGMGALFLLWGVVIGILTLLSARGLAKHRRYWLSFIVACIECLSVPLGTALGVFTLIVLSRDSVKALYGKG
ncbi:hypothetical protein [Leptolyngbya sp. PCC 6406]|uniref:hypothetical protein n=1 Tax=Leptolyngbya sp. PCC 6406 TaxID=1173264 RepID=UPI0002AC0CF7|nr:hypothetical protein [Leptolyngbya sp. PCC 6406]